MENKEIIEVIEILSNLFDSYENILIGAGAGLSSSAGHTYSGKRFEENFSDFIEKYHLPDMYSAGFYPFKTLEEKWAYWSRHIELNRYRDEETPVYSELLKLVENKNYFIKTTNVDHLFQRAGFDKQRLFYTQGDYGLFQCSVPCHNETYDNEEIIKQMVEKQKDMKIPSDLIPYCPKCGAPMTTNLRADNTFVQDKGWYRAAERYEKYLEEYADKKILIVDLGIGGNTPSIIKYPFWQMTAKNENSIYLCINKGEAIAPKDIQDRSILIDGDIGLVLDSILEFRKANETT